MSAGAEPAVVVCRCGKRMKMTGAVPGRVGRCPSCGATFRVPLAGPEPPPPPAAAPRAPSAPGARPGPGPGRPAPNRARPALGDDAPPARASYDLGGGTARDPGSTTLNPSANPERLGTLKSRATLQPVGRGGLLRLPAKAESNPLGSLAYPLWDAAGLSWLAVLPVPLTIASLVVFWLIPKVHEGGEMALFGPIAYAFIVVFAFAVSYTLAVLGDVLVASAQGDVHHPRWPDIELGGIATALYRWAVAFGFGVGLMVFPAMGYWRDHPQPGTLERVVFAETLAFGGFYSLMALLAIYLHEDALAANPRTVFHGIGRVGLAYLAPVFALAATFAIASLIIQGIYRLSGFWPVFLATWAGWVVAVYCGLVVMRMLGRAYHRRAKRVGWFPSRRRRREEPMGPTPEPIPEL